MTKEEIIESISENYSFLGPQSSSEFIANSKLLVFDSPTTLVREGQYSEKAFYLIKGCARAYYLKNGKDISDWFAFEGTFICPVNSFFQNVPSPLFIETLEPSILLEVSKEDVDRLSDKHREVERLIQVITVKTMLQLQERVVSIQFQSAEQKYNDILSIYPNITQRVPLKHIASYIGITLETLSRIRNPKNRI